MNDVSQITKIIPAYDPSGKVIDANLYFKHSGDKPFSLTDLFKGSSPELVLSAIQNMVSLLAEKDTSSTRLCHHGSAPSRCLECFAT